MKFTYHKTNHFNVNNYIHNVVQAPPLSSSQTSLPDFVIKVYWNRTMLIHLYILYGCFHTSVAELSSCNCKAKTFMWPFVKTSKPWSKSLVFKLKYAWGYLEGFLKHKLLYLQIWFSNLSEGLEFAFLTSFQVMLMLRDPSVFFILSSNAFILL